MDVSEVKEKVKNIIIESLNLDISADEIDGSDLKNEFMINSVDVISIFVFIENIFNIEIKDEDLSVELISSLDKITNFILSKIN